MKRSGILTRPSKDQRALECEQHQHVPGRGADGTQHRQLAAIAGQPDRTARLRRLRIPTLVIHGLHDPLVAPSGGLAIARHLPNAKFVGYSGMGHDLPRELWPDMVDEIGRLASRADGV